jgi:hypothetical protein
VEITTRLTSQEDGGLDQVFDPLPESTLEEDSTIEVNDEADDKVESPPPVPRKRGRLKGSKNRPKNTEPATIRLESMTTSQED